MPRELERFIVFSGRSTQVDVRPSRSFCVPHAQAHICSVAGALTLAERDLERHEHYLL